MHMKFNNKENLYLYECIKTIVKFYSTHVHILEMKGFVCLQESYTFY